MVIELVFCAGLVLASCANQAVQVSLASPVESKSPVADSRVVFSNCGNLEQMQQSLSEKAQVTITTTIEDYATAVKTGEKVAIPDDQIKELTVKIQDTYQQAINDAKIKVEQTVLKIPGDRIHHYQILWKRQTFSADVIFNMDNQDFTTAYTCVMDIPEAVFSTELICTG